MNEYDFVKLNDKEFESLSVDLLSKIEGKRIERFKLGKDFGVDGRFFASDGAEVIIQCKHWARSGTTALIRNLKKQELQLIQHFLLIMILMLIVSILMVYLIILNKNKLRDVL